MVTFTVEGLKQDINNYVFNWDFDGDASFDKEVEGNNLITHSYDTANLYNVMVRVVDKEGNTGDFNLEMPVKEPTATSADFEFTIDGATVNFVNHSVPSARLADKGLTYKWSFGDTDTKSYESQKSQIGIANPTYKYSKPGRYLVVLTVVDADQVSATKISEVLIDASAFPDSQVVSGDATDAQDHTDSSDEAGKKGSIFITILKVILYIIITLLILLFLIFGGFILFLKIQHPDLTFEELIDELKIKILHMLGVGDMIEMPGHSQDSQPPAANSDEPIIPSRGPRIDLQPAPKEEVIEGEVVEKETPEQDFSSDDDSSDDSDDDDTTPPASGGGDDESVHAPGDDSLNKQDGPVPDWLKGV